jgi:tungstate transport system permease protein
MTDFQASGYTAIELILELDSNLLEIILLSLKVTLSSTFISAILGIYIGTMVSIRNFPGKNAIIILLNSFMGLPPVVVGLFVYLMISRAGPLGIFGLLYTPTAMIIAQSILITPIIAALTRQIVSDLWIKYELQFRSLALSLKDSFFEIIWDARHSLLTAIFAGLGRAMAEVGAVIIVGGNIEHVTRVMTTTIVMETSKGNLGLAMALGIILLLITFLINLALFFISKKSKGY